PIKLLVARRLGRPEDEADVHHNVDEERLWAEERSQVAARLAPQGERSAGVHQYVAQRRLAGPVIPAQVRGEEQEAEIVNGPVEPPPFQRPAQALGLVAPLRVAGVLVQQPQNAGKEPLAPVGPALAFLSPGAADSVHRRVAGMVGQNAPGLGCSEGEGALERGRKIGAHWIGWVSHDFWVRMILKATEYQGNENQGTGKQGSSFGEEPSSRVNVLKLSPQSPERKRRVQRTRRLR